MTRRPPLGVRDRHGWPRFGRGEIGAAGVGGDSTGAGDIVPRGCAKLAVPQRGPRCPTLGRHEMRNLTLLALGPLCLATAVASAGPGWGMGGPGYAPGYPGYGVGWPGYGTGWPGYELGGPGYGRGYPGYGMGGPGYGAGGPGYGVGGPGYGPGFFGSEPGYVTGGPPAGSPGDASGRPGSGWARPTFRGPAGLGERGTQRGYGRGSQGDGRGPSRTGPNPRQEQFRSQ